MRSKLIVLCAVACAAVPHAQEAPRPLSAAALIDACRAYAADPASSHGIRCEGYLRGFVDGAATIDERVRTAGVGDAGWARRAARTRLGRTVAARTPPFCIAEPTTIAEVIEIILGDVRSRPADDALMAHQAVADALRRHYRCGT